MIPKMPDPKRFTVLSKPVSQSLNKECREKVAARQSDWAEQTWHHG